ncbi:MAG: hypothetical protein U0P28_02270 [Ruminococcus sp.]|nr:hypothetical protein [uncultured Ruminococcus sp.]MBQ2427568.1 hypothetical protein [Ruminococcus sp.]MDO4892534.1 hypothetical protein [Eubacteriales bacterium]
MSEKKRKNTKPSESDSQQDPEEITLSDETLAEIGEPDKEQVFKNVAKAYEEVKRKRERYKKIGPVFVAVSGVAFLTLIFTLENKITFLILWVITILYTVALMIRAEYKYHQFRNYLGLADEESEEAVEDESQNAEQEVRT